MENHTDTILTNTPFLKGRRISMTAFLLLLIGCLSITKSYGGVNVALSTPATVPAGTACTPGTNNVIYRFTLTGGGTFSSPTSANFTALTFTQSGTATSADIVTYKLWASSVSGSPLATSTTTSFSGFSTSYSILGTSKDYYITADVASGATIGNTIIVDPLTTSDFTTSAGTKSTTGTIAAGGAQTLGAAPTITGPLAICVGSTVSLTGAPSGGTWTSGTTSVATIGSSSGAVVGVAPGTSVISYTQGGCTATQTETASNLVPPSFTITPNSATICPGNGQLLSAPPVSAGSNTTTYSSTGSFTVPDNSSTGATGAITISGIPSDATIVDMAVDLNSITMSSDRDLAINIAAPNGNILNLFDQNGNSSTAHFTNTIISSLGSTNFGTTGPYTGTWEADASNNVGPTAWRSNVSSWSSLYSTPNGTWTLAIRDARNSNTATVNSWSVIIHYTTPAASYSWNPASGLFTNPGLTAAYNSGDPADDVYASPSALTTYTATKSETGTGCVSTSTATITMGASPSLAGLSTGSSVCYTTSGVLSASYGYSGPTNGASDYTVTWSPAGPTPTAVFTPLPGGAIYVDVPSGTAAGPYTGTLTIKNPSGCTSVSTITLTVNPLPSPAVITGTKTVCAGGATTALSDASTGGTWSSFPTSVATVNSTGTVTGVNAGTATISYTMVNGCGATAATAIVTVNPLPIPPAGITGTLTVCEAGSTTSLGETTTGGAWSSGTTSVANISGTGVVTGVTAGTSIISYTVTNSCGNARATAIVTVNPLPVVPAAITGSSSVCENGATIDLDNITNGGAWSSANPSVATVDAVTGVVTGVSAGTARISYIISTPSCGSTNKTVLVTVNPLPAAPAAITGTAVVCEGATTTLADATIGGAWSSDNNAVATVDAGGVVTGVVAGTVTIGYTMTNGCGNTPVTTTVTVNPLPATPGVINGTATVCEAGATTTLSDLPSGGTWSSDNLSAATVDAAGLVTGVSAGTSSVTYTITNSCGSANAAVTVTVNPLPMVPASIAGTAPVCEGGATVLLSDVTSGGSWSSNNTAMATVDPSSGLVTGVGAGTAIISYTISNSCGNNSVTTDVTVNPLPAMPAAITGTYSACAGGGTTALADATLGGVWSSDNSAIASVDPTGLVTGVSAGTANISYTSTNGCGSASATAVLTITSLPDAGIITGTRTVCASGATTTLSSTITGGTWNSSNTSMATIDAGGIITGLTAGDVIIDYTVSNGCGTATANAVITVNPLVTTPSIAGATDVCAGSATTLTSVSADGIWSSSDISKAMIDPFSGVVTGISAGTVTISYTVSNICNSAYTTASFSVNPKPSVITGVPQVCIGGATTFGNAFTGGTWTSSNMFVATITPATGVLSGTATGATVVSYTLATGCQVTTTVNVNPLPSAYLATGGGSYCAGGVGVPVGLSNSSLGDVYQLYNGASPVGIPMMGTGSVLNFGLRTAGGAYTIKATSLATGCVNTMPGSSVVVVNDLPAIYSVIGGGSYCEGSGGVHVGLSSSNTGINYELFHGITHVAGPLSGTGAAVDFGALTENQVYIVKATNASTGCVSNMTGSATVSTKSLPVAYSVIGGGSLCAGAAGVHIGLSYSNNGISYSLHNGASTIGAPVSGSNAPLDFGSFSAAGSYTIVATNSLSGCTKDMTGSADVVVNSLITPAVSLSTGAGTTICSGRTVSISTTTSNGGATPSYQWMVNGVAHAGSGSTFSYIPHNGDIVGVKMTSSASCLAAPAATGSIGLTVLESGMPSVTISADHELSICQGTPVSYITTTTFEGTPAFTWFVNGVNVGSHPFYSYTPGNHDDIFVTMTSNYVCRQADVVSSDHVIMSVQNSAPPVVSITSNASGTVYRYQDVTLTATASGAGPTPSYQWFINGIPAPHAFSSEFTYNMFADGDSVSCVVTSSGVCSGIAGSKSMIMHINTVGVKQIVTGTANVSLVPNPNKGIFTVKGTIGTTDEEAVLEVTDMLGHIVYTSKVSATNGNISEHVQLGSNLANGMYLLNLGSATQNSVFHFVVEN